MTSTVKDLCFHWNFPKLKLRMTFYIYIYIYVVVVVVVGEKNMYKTIFVPDGLKNEYDRFSAKLEKDPIFRGSKSLFFRQRMIEYLGENKETLVEQYQCTHLKNKHKVCKYSFCPKYTFSFPEFERQNDKCSFRIRAIVAK